MHTSIIHISVTTNQQISFTCDDKQFLTEFNEMLQKFLYEHKGTISFKPE